MLWTTGIAQENKLAVLSGVYVLYTHVSWVTWSMRLIMRVRVKSGLGVMNPLIIWLVGCCAAQHTLPINLSRVA